MRRRATVNTMSSSSATEASRLHMSDEHRAAIEHVVTIVRALAALPAESRQLQVRVVKNLLWIVTEFKPGYTHKILGVRLRTPAAHEAVLARSFSIVRHEHVVERDLMARRLLDLPEQAEALLWNYPACLVTTAEHSALGRTDAWGWGRYVAAGLNVSDAETGEPMALEEMDLGLRQLYEKAFFFN